MSERDTHTPAEPDPADETAAKHDGGHWAIDVLLWFPEMIGGLVRGIAWCVVCVVELVSSTS